MKNQKRERRTVPLCTDSTTEHMLSVKPPKTCVERSSTVIKQKESQLNMGLVEKASRWTVKVHHISTSDQLQQSIQSV